MSHGTLQPDWSQRLNERRALTFIGRAAERRLFRDAVSASVLPFQVFAIVAPGGAGKTTLLKMLASDCLELETDAVTLDGRSFQANPDDFLASFRAALQTDAGQDLWQTVAGRGRFVLFIDNYDALFPLHNWLCDAFFPRLPQNALVVTASRQMPPEPWQTDPAWKALIHTRALDNLSADESADYLTLRGVPAAEHDEIVRFSHGHPLTLSLVADLYDRRPDSAFGLATAPDVVQTIVRRFAGDVTDAMCRHALEACALVRVMTESLLSAMLEVRDAGQAFAWLCDLSFVDTAPGGIYPHDLVREVLTLDLKWRHPDRYDALRLRAHKYYHTRLQHADETVRHDALTDLLFLHRHHDVLNPLLGQAFGAMVPEAERAARSDHARIVQLIQNVEGPASARVAARWLALHPEGARVVRGTDGGVAAFLFILRLRMQAGELFVDSVDQQAPVREVNDEITTALCAFVLGDNPEGRPLLRDGEKMTITRYGVDAKTHQRPSPGVAALTVELVRDFVTTPNLKLTFNVMANPDEWEPIARQLNFFQRLQPFQFAVGGLTFGVFMQDWRHESPQHWIARIAPDREWHPVSDKHPAIVAATPEAQPLSRLTSKLTTDASSTAWLRHTRHALKHLHAPDVLMKNPLIELTIVRNMTSDTTHNTANMNVFGPALALQRLVMDTVQSFAAQPDRAKLYKALHYTFIEPQGTQEQVAEFLNIPFSTYRGHLRAGIDTLAVVLRELEIHSRG